MKKILIRNARIVNEGKIFPGDLLLKNGLIEKIVDMDDSQLNALLNGNKVNIKDDFRSCNFINDRSILLDDHKRESDFLMETLDSLRQ